MNPLLHLSPIECADELEELVEHELTEDCSIDEDWDDMDSDDAGALASAGFGTDEDHE